MGELEGKQVSRSNPRDPLPRSDKGRYWEAKLAPGHVPSEGYAALKAVFHYDMLKVLQKNRELHKD